MMMMVVMINACLAYSWSTTATCYLSLFIISYIVYGIVLANHNNNNHNNYIH